MSLGSSRGVGLAEALVAITVLALAGTVALVLYESARESFKLGDNLTEQQQVVRIAYDELAGDLRLAGLNSNPDGDKTRPDEQIELAAATAIVFRADFDADDPVASVFPEEDLADTGSGAKFKTVSTGNDEIVAYVLASADSSETASFDADLLPSVRDGSVEAIDIEDVALTQDDPPYTLYRVTFDETGAGLRTPVIDNVRFLNFRYFDGAGEELAPAGGMDDAAGLGRSARASIRRIGIEIEGLTRDAYVGWVDPHDPVPGPLGRGQYRKFSLAGDVTPRNLGMFGVKDLEAQFSPPSTPPPPTLHRGHCEALWIAWAPNPPQDEVARYELRYGTDPDNLAGPDYADQPRYYLDGLLDDTQYYVTIQAVDDSGNISPASDATHETTEDLNLPEQPADLAATGGADALDNAIQLSWSPVEKNVVTPTAEPVEDPIWPQLRDSSGYWIHRGTSAGFAAGPDNRIAEPSSVEFTDEQVVNCRQYTYQVTAVDLCEKQSDIAEISGKSTHFVGPAAPINVQAQWSGEVEGSHIRVEWDSVVKDVLGTSVYIEDYWVHRARGEADTPEGLLEFSPWEPVIGETWFQEELGGLGAMDTVWYYRVTAHDDCVNESIPSQIVSADCTFAGEVAIVEPLDHHEIQPADEQLPIHVDVLSAGAAYDSMHLAVVNLATGLTVMSEDLSTDPPWSVDWSVETLPAGDYRIDSSVAQSGPDGCVETTSRFVSKLP